MTTRRRKPLKPFLFTTTILFLAMILLLCVSYFTFEFYFLNKIYPNVYVTDINIGGKTVSEAKELVLQRIQIPEKLTLQTKDEPIELSLKEFGLDYDVDTTVTQAFDTYRDKDEWTDSKGQIASITQMKNIPLLMYFDNKKLDEFLSVAANSQTEPPMYPTATLTNGQIVVNPGKSGEEIDIQLLKETILTNLRNLNFEPIPLSSKEINPALSEDEVETFKTVAEKLIGKSITLSYEFTTYTLTTPKLLSLLNPRDTIFEPKAKELITKEVNPLFNRPAQNAAFKLTDGKVEEFKPAKEGVTINETELLNELKSKVYELKDSDEKVLTLKVPVQTAAANVTTQEVNDLGINELIGRGTSVFKGSIASRVFNVGHASSKMNGVLIPPNTTFSFDDTVGDVSQLTGYKQAYIIQNGRTILGDGGGLCQVSTTLFRAALNAGLPIVERRAHAYRVGYYEQDSGPGLDATVYVPTTDFKFKNDTPNTILIQTIFDAKAMTLAFELYGTKDGRVATVTKPIITKQIAPAEDLYVDDPTLPTGKVNQVEHKAWGATVKFDYKVTRNGETIYEKTFTSVYQPWQAVYMKGTGPAV